MTQKTTIRIAHSPDSDDAYFFYALKHEKITHPLYSFEIVRKDIEELNQMAKDEVYDITAISIHAYAYLSDQYVLTASAMSMAEKDYGPVIVTTPQNQERSLNDMVVAVPGEWTTACLILRLIEPNVTYRPYGFDDIIGAVQSGEVDAGLLIHEGQLQFEDEGLCLYKKTIDYWKSIAGDLPLPLGGSAIRRSLGPKVIKDLAQIQLDSVIYAREHHEEARNYAMQFKRDLTEVEADQYLGWYANDRTVDLGAEGREALNLLLNKASDSGLLLKPANINIV